MKELMKITVLKQQLKLNRNPVIISFFHLESFKKKNRAELTPFL